MEIFFKKLIANISFLMMRVLDGIMELFSVFTGIQSSVTSAAATGENVQGQDILTFFMEQPIISKIFISILIISVVLLAIFTIVAFIKGFFSVKKKPAKIIEEFAGAFLAFFVVLIVLFGGIMVSNRTLQLINDEFIVSSNDAADLTLSQRLINIAVEDGGWRETGEGTYYTASNFSPQYNADKVFGQYETSFGLEKSPGKYEDVVQADGSVEQVAKDDTYKSKSGGIIDLFKTNLLILLVSSASILLLLATSLIELARRVFDIIFLYLVMPMAVSTIPLDDGAKFKLWKDSMVTKVLCVYGTVIAINLYIMFLEIIGDGINIGTTAWVQTLFNLILMIGGALAASSGARLFGQIIGAQNDPGRNLGQTIYTAMMAGQMTAGIARSATGKKFGHTRRGIAGSSTGGRIGGLFGGAKSAFSGAGKVLFGNRYTETMAKGKSSYNHLKETLKGGFMNNGGLAGMALKGAGAMTNQAALAGERMKNKVSDLIGPI